MPKQQTDEGQKHLAITLDQMGESLRTAERTISYNHVTATLGELRMLSFEAWRPILTRAIVRLAREHHSEPGAFLADLSGDLARAGAEASLAAGD